MASHVATNDGNEVTAYLSEHLKAAVTAGLKMLMDEHPDHPVEYLAQFLKKQSGLYKDDAFTVDVGSGLVCSLAPLSVKSKRGQPAPIKQVHNHAVFGLQCPSALEIQRAIDAAEESMPKKQLIHLVVELPNLLEDAVFCLGNPFVVNLPGVLETLRLRECGTASALPDLATAQKQLMQALGRQRRPQSLSDIVQSLKASVPIKLTILPTLDIDGTKLFETLDNVVGITDSQIDRVNPIVVVSLRRRRDSMLLRIMSIVVALLRPMDEVRAFQQLDVMQASVQDVKAFAFHEHQKYWNTVLDRRDKRDKMRLQKEEEAKQAIYEARVAAAKEAAAALAAATAAAAQATETGGVAPSAAKAPHPPAETYQRFTRGNQQQSDTPQLQLPPPPPPDPEEVEARRKALLFRQNRRQQEDSEFVQIVKRTRAQCVQRIQRLFRNWRSRARRALVERDLRAAESKGNEIPPEAEAYRDMLKEPDYTGPALLQKAWFRLKQVHGDLFSTLPPPPPVPPRRKHYFAPQRARIAPHYKDDVSSEDERWVEHVQVIPDRSQRRRSVYFNPFIRLQKCYEATGNDNLEDAEDIQIQFRGLSNLQRRAYGRILDSAMDLLHIAFVEMSHRELLPKGITSFPTFIHTFHEEFYSWMSLPHEYASATALTGVPRPMISGPSNPLADRLLYISVEVPHYQPWSDNEHSVQAGRILQQAGNLRYLTRVTKTLHFSTDVLDRNKWVAAVQHLVDDEKIEKIVWVSTCRDPIVYVHGRPFVLAKRPLNQIVDGKLKWQSIEAQVVQKVTPVQPTVSTSSTNLHPLRTSMMMASNRGLLPHKLSGSQPQLHSPDSSHLMVPGSPSTGQNCFKMSSNEQDRSFPQFGVSIVEFENSLRNEVHKAAECNQGNVTYCTTTTAAEILSKPVAPPSVSISVGGQLDAETSSQHGGTAGDMTPQIASPVTLSVTETFFDAYYLDSVNAPEVVTREWPLQLKIRSDDTPMQKEHNGIVLGPKNLGGGDAGAGVVAATNGLSGRGLRKKIGSRIETMSQRKSGFGGESFQNASASVDQGAGGGANSAGGHAINDLMIPPVATPHQEARLVAAQDSINKFSMEFHRFSVHHMAGPEFLLALDRFASFAFRTLVMQSTLVVAMADDDSMLLGAIALLLDSHIRAFHTGGDVQGLQLPVETSFDTIYSPEELSIAPTQGMAHTRDTAPALWKFCTLVTQVSTGKHQSVFGDSESLVTSFEQMLARANLLNTFVSRVAHLYTVAQQMTTSTTETSKAARRRTVIDLTCGLERLCWLLLFHVFLCEIAGQLAAAGSQEVELPSFSSWLFQPRWESTLAWITTLDPWEENPLGCPDTAHTRYSNVYRRWQEDSCITAAY